MIDTPNAQLQAAIERRLLEDPRTRNAIIDVACLAGQVTLSGTVPTPAVKAAAEEIARSVPGVTLVINELIVR
ncbi:MAG TPA: BON domain-containing protein [Chloroflexota bacterium]|jgi:osmotically-inducible protein OsmY|nr:BON domain-containing protein [Chloroflexota bacterium]